MAADVLCQILLCENRPQSFPLYCYKHKLKFILKMAEIETKTWERSSEVFQTCHSNTIWNATTNAFSQLFFAIFFLASFVVGLALSVINTINMENPLN